MTALAGSQSPAPEVPADAPARPGQHLGLALVVISCAQLMVVLDATIVNIALPSMSRALHFSPANLQWVITSYTLTFGGLLLFGGRTGDLFGRRRMFMLGIGIFALASLMGGLATYQAWLIAARAAQGVGGAIAAPTALALIATTFPEGPPRNKAMGVYAAMSGGGSAIGLLMGGILTDVASWRWVLFVNVPIAAIVLALAPRALAETDAEAGRLDVPGAISVTAAMALLVYGFTNAASHSWGATGTVLPLALAVALAGAFLLIESRSAHPLMPLRILANRNRAASYGVMLCVVSALFAMFFFLTQFVQNILGFSPLKAGLGFLPVSAILVVVAGITSVIVAKVNQGLITALGTLVSAAGLFWMAQLHVGSNYLDVLGPTLVLGAGMGVVFVTLTLTSVSGVRDNEQGLAGALLNACQQVGGSLGLAVLGSIAVTSIRHHAATLASQAHGALTRQMANVATVDGYRLAFLVAAFIALAGAVIATFLRIPRQTTPGGEPAAEFALEAAPAEA